MNDSPVSLLEVVVYAIGVFTGLRVLRRMEEDIGLERAVWIVYLAYFFGGKG